MRSTTTTVTKTMTSNGLVRVPCSRCNSSGQYMQGAAILGQCFACAGKGFRWERPATTGRRKLKPETIAKREYVEQLKRRLYVDVQNELNTKFGPFDLQDALQKELLNLEVMRATGKSIVLHRDERLALTLKANRLPCASHKDKDGSDE